MAQSRNAQWFQNARELLNSLESTQGANIQAAADLIFDRLLAGGRLFVFGSGHSAILVEEVFHRAGGLVPVVPILASFLTPHLRPSISGKLEKIEGIGTVLFQTSGVDPQKDVFLMASNSGVNAAIVDVAWECQKSKVPVVAMTSLKHSQTVTSKHSCGKKLFELANVVLDNCCPYGDALIAIGAETKVAAGSSLANVTLWNAVLVLIAQKFQSKRDENPAMVLPFYKSANTPGGSEHNEKLERLYKGKLSL